MGVFLNLFLIIIIIDFRQNKQKNKISKIIYKIQYASNSCIILA